ncbi:hypothetical protein [Porticoccus sp.]
MKLKSLARSMALFSLLATSCFADTTFDETLLEAQQGNVQAQRELGILYANGAGTAQDNINAYIWLSAAKHNGDQIAAKNIPVLKKHMSLQEIVKGQARAARCIGSNYQHCK